MTRSLTSGMQTAVAAQTGTIVYFLQLESSGGTTRICTAPGILSWDSQTWTGIGGALAFGGVEETPDPSGQGVELTLSGVEQSIIAILMNNQVRGREVRIWLAHVADAGTIIADPLEIFRGFQLADYRINEQRPHAGAGTVTVKTRVQSRLSILRNPLPVRVSEISHNDMLKRAGLTVGDTFFRNTLGVVGRQIRWGPYVIGDPVGLPRSWREFVSGSRG